MLTLYAYFVRDVHLGFLDRLDLRYTFPKDVLRLAQPVNRYL